MYGRMSVVLKLLFQGALLVQAWTHSVRGYDYDDDHHDDDAGSKFSKHFVSPLEELDSGHVGWGMWGDTTQVAITEITEIPASTSGGPAGFSAVAFTANRKAVFSPGMDQAHICAGWDNTRVGILDLDTSQYETFELTDCNQDPPSPLPANGWGGAAAVGNKVVFAPAHHWWNPNPSKASIGVFDAGTPYSFNRIDIESDLASVGITDTRELFLGAVTIGSVVVFTPGRSVVGIFDPVTSQYRQVQTQHPTRNWIGFPRGRCCGGGHQGCVLSVQRQERGDLRARHRHHPYA